jgi:hypothetical protein
MSTRPEPRGTASGERRLHEDRSQRLGAPRRVFRDFLGFLQSSLRWKLLHVAFPHLSVMGPCWRRPRIGSQWECELARSKQRSGPDRERRLSYTPVPRPKENCHASGSPNDQAS